MSLEIDRVEFARQILARGLGSRGRAGWRPRPLLSFVLVAVILMGLLASLNFSEAKLRRFKVRIWRDLQVGVHSHE